MWWECFTPLLAPREQVVSQFRVSQRGSSRLVFLLLMMMAIQGLEEEEPFNFLAPSLYHSVAGGAFQVLDGFIELERLTALDAHTTCCEG